MSSSPWIRGAPQSGLEPLICRIRSRIFRSIDGRPDLERQRQNSRPRVSPVISYGNVRRAGFWPGAQTLRPALAQLSHSVTADEVFGSDRKRTTVRSPTCPMPQKAVGVRGSRLRRWRNAVGSNRASWSPSISWSGRLRIDCGTRHLWHLPRYTRQEHLSRRMTLASISSIPLSARSHCHGPRRTTVSPVSRLTSSISTFLYLPLGKKT